MTNLDASSETLSCRSSSDSSPSPSSSPLLSSSSSSSSSSKVVLPADVLCHVLCNCHVGNRRYAVVVSNLLVVFVGMDDDRLSRAILRAVYSYGGRLLGRTKRQTWKQLGDKLAISWIKRHLHRIRYLEGRRSITSPQRQLPVKSNTTDNTMGKDETCDMEENNGDNDDDSHKEPGNDEKDDANKEKKQNEGLPTMENLSETCQALLYLRVG